MPKKIWTESRKSRLRKAVNYIASEFNICLYTFRYSWVEESDEQGKGMRILVDWPYKNVFISCFPDGKDMKGDELYSYVAHELTHVLLWPLDANRLKADKIYDNYLEEVTDNLSLLLWDLIKHQKKRK